MKNIALRFYYSTIELVFRELAKAVVFIAKQLEGVEIWAIAKKAKLQ
jgi:hypothetical protein